MASLTIGIRKAIVEGSTARLRQQERLDHRP